MPGVAVMASGLVLLSHAGYCATRCTRHTASSAAADTPGMLGRWLARPRPGPLGGFRAVPSAGIRTGCGKRHQENRDRRRWF